MPAVRNEAEGRERVERLVNTFSANLSHYKSPDFPETAARNQFIDPLFEALGWDVADEGGAGPRRDVVVENRQRTEATAAGEEEWDDELTADELAGRSAETRFPDYVFRIDLRNRFVAEAKKPSVNLARKAPSFQAKSYAWTMRLPIAVLTDFEELRVFDARYRPHYDEPDAGLMPGFGLHFTQYLDSWPSIWGVLSREGVLAGALDGFISRHPARGAQPMDRSFLAELARWRERLAKDLYHRNPDLNHWEIAEATQRILDRVVFTRVMEDRGIVSEPLLRRHARLPDSYRRLAPEFRRLDAVYNGQLFAYHFSERLELSDEVFQMLVASMYFPAPYRFDVVAVDLLGSIYERFLGQEITASPRDGIKVEDKPEVRHAGGVYYTPRWVVERIVERTVGPLVEGKTPRAVANIKIVDPACGSGAFLLGAFHYLVTWHERYYDQHPEENANGHFVTAAGERRLTADTKATILANNIFGVDLDAQAVEVTQMSLYLALLQDENLATLQAQQRLFESAFLPKLDHNIRWGNSLLASDDLPDDVLFGSEELRRRVNPLDWWDSVGGFGEVFEKRGGFDAVIGNPPYTRVQVLRQFRPEEAAAYQAKYASASEGSFDIASPFIERGLELLRPNGRLSFIVSRQFCETAAGRPLREMLAGGRHVQEIVDFGAGLVFDPVSAYTLILVLGRSPSRSWRLTRVPSPPGPRALVAAEAEGSPLTATLPAADLGPGEWSLGVPAERDLLQRLSHAHPSLGDVSGNVVFQGVVTGADYIYRLRDLGPGPQEGLRRVARRDAGTEGVVEEALLRPVLAGRSDIHRFHIAPAQEVLLVPYRRPRPHQPFVLMSRSDLARFPHAEAWLDRHADELRARAGEWTDHTWWAFSRRQNLERFEEPKILVPYMIDHLCAHLDERGYFFVNVTTGGYGIPIAGIEDPAYVAALLNSRLLSWALRRYSRAFRGGWFAARKGNLVRLPIAQPAEQRRAEVVESHDRCVATQAALSWAPEGNEKELAKRAHRDAVRRFDRLVEAVYGLDAAEVALIEAS